MKAPSGVKNQKNSIVFNRMAYILFSVAGICFYFIGHDLSQTTVFFGLALVFDPFDQSVKWKDRPLYQRVWLFVHSALTIAVFTAMMIAGQATGIKK